MVSLLAWNFRSFRRRCRGVAVIVLSLLCAGTALADPSMDVSFDRSTISLGDSAVLTVNFHECSPSSPALPTVDGLQYGGTSVNQSFSLVNGAMSRSVSYSFEVHPTRDGRFTIPAFEVTSSGVHLRSQPVTLTVVRGNPGNPGAPGGRQVIAYVKIVPATNVIYVGQVLKFDLECYCRDNVADIQLPTISSDNFIIGDIPNKHQVSTRVQVGDVPYNRFTFTTTAMAIKAGRYDLGPANWSMMVLTGQQNFFGMRESRQASFTSDVTNITVLPIPTDGAPPAFNGAVGEFTLAQYEASPTSVNVGDPITLKIRIAGQGAFDTVTLPTNSGPAWHEFRTYPPTSKFESTGDLNLEGSKYFEEVVTPQNAEVKEIPPFVFSFFDPVTGQFRSLTGPAIPLTVRATASAPQPTVVSTGGSTPDGQDQSEDIVHIKPMMGTLEPVRAPLIERPGFLALQALAPILWIVAMTRRKMRENLANNPRLRRQREVSGIVRAGLGQLPHLASSNDADKFFSTVLRLLQEQLGERLDLPAPAITEAIIDELPRKELSQETAAVIHELFQACNQYRYTPDHTAQGMNSLIPKVRTVMKDLQAMPAAPARRGMAAAVGIALLLLAAGTVRAETAAELFNQGNKFYEEGKYTQAAAEYQKIVQGGEVSPAVYFNLGNSFYKAGQPGRAVSAYRRAEAIAPRDPDVRANLQTIRAQVGSPVLPGSRWTRWVGRLTLNEWTAATSVAVALLFLYLTARELVPSLRKSGQSVIVAGSLACVCLAVCLGLSIEQRLVEKFAVVTVSEAVARRGPLPEAQSIFTVRDGAELRVLGTDGDWLQVSDAGNHIGWLAQNQVAFVP